MQFGPGRSNGVCGRGARGREIEQWHSGQRPHRAVGELFNSQPVPIELHPLPALQFLSEATDLTRPLLNCHKDNPGKVSTKILGFCSSLADRGFLWGLRHCRSPLLCGRWEKVGGNGRRPALFYCDYRWELII